MAENYNWNVGDQNRGKGLKKETEYAVLVGVIHGNDTEETAKEYMDELEFLALTAGAVTLKRFMQKQLLVQVNLIALITWF